MTLVIERSAGAVVVRALTADGRHAVRTVHDPRALTATALGLVMAIPENATEGGPPPAQNPTPAQASVAAPAPPVGGRAASASPGGDNSPAVSAQDATQLTVGGRTIAVWLGFAVGGRIAAPTSILTLEFEAYANVLLGPWFLIASFRDAPTGLVASQGVDEDAFRQVSAGLGFGRRIVAGASAINLGLQLALVAMQMEYDFPPRSLPSSVHGTDVDFSLDAFARLALPLSPSWKLTLTIDAEFIPSNIATPDRLDIPAGAMIGTSMPPPFPAVTSGLRIGATGALL